MLRQTARIVAAYLECNALAPGDVPALIRTTYAALAATESPEPVVLPQPAVPVRKSVTPGAVICLDCGRPQKTLKRHIETAHGLSPERYRGKWGLPADYPMVAPDYAAHRSQLAIRIGLGQTRNGAAAEPAAETGPAVEGKPNHRYPTSRWARPVE